jgi:uncharacterized protein YjbJ (UPF0337 family)
LGHCSAANQTSFAIHYHRLLNKKEINMNWDHIEANWDQFSEIIRVQWGKLTVKQIIATKGNRNQLEGIIQASYGISKEAADQQVGAWLKHQDEEAYLIERATERNGSSQ